MLSLNIQGPNVYFRDIKPEHLPSILQWYNKIGDFKFATGIDEPMSLEVLTQKYAEVAICKNEFFVGVYTWTHHQMVGALKGRLESGSKGALWISSIVIDSAYQRNGYGSEAVNLLLGNFRNCSGLKTVLLSVIEENIHGRRFWIKHGFSEVRRMENHIRLQEKQQNILIMQKSLGA